jgi:hypothetical protein
MKKKIKTKPGSFGGSKQEPNFDKVKAANNQKKKLATIFAFN